MRGASTAGNTRDTRTARPRYTHPMINAWRNFAGRVRSAFRFVALFLVVRVIVGVGVIVFFDRDAVAWGPELTVVVIGAVAVVLLVGLAVRHVDAHPRSGR